MESECKNYSIANFLIDIFALRNEIKKNLFFCHIAEPSFYKLMILFLMWVFAVRRGIDLMLIYLNVAKIENLDAGN